jgi:hypothetical protein
MKVKDIIEVKDHLQDLKERGLINSWELPYENILTRRSAAIFFFTPTSEGHVAAISLELEKYENFAFRINEEKKLSQLQYRVTFSAEEKEKILAAQHLQQQPSGQ